MILIDGKKLAEKIKDEVVKEVLALSERPNLAIVIVGDKSDSRLYVSLKERQAKTVGIDTHVYRLAENISEEELTETIKFLNSDETIDAILLQLPLPEHLNTDNVVGAIDPEKDVDGFHPSNLSKIMADCEISVEPPLVLVVLEILKSINFSISGKKAIIIANSDFFGQVIKRVLECRGAQTELILASDFKAEQTCEADLLVTAVGQPGIIKGVAVKQDAVIIDIGISHDEMGKVVGDVDFDSVKDKVSYLTPVPGGVGPMTIAMAFKNTVKIFKQRHR
ncbi:MAG: bifunctional 5,10-methylenetetrahydrofolate dehydrogenase/5,10-methenyltetrahydrofolate cyclohydrolase [bacterium]